jgi:hypothetical protein
VIVPEGSRGVGVLDTVQAVHTITQVSELLRGEDLLARPAFPQQTTHASQVAAQHFRLREAHHGVPSTMRVYDRHCRWRSPLPPAHVRKRCWRLLHRRCLRCRRRAHYAHRLTNCTSKMLALRIRSTQQPWMMLGNDCLAAGCLHVTSGEAAGAHWC